ncbi:MAG: UDP-2,3-diacylglucosamine diphosphatase LpxI [Roseovarius sp.]
MTLALVAGQGGVPPHLVRTLLARGEVPLVCEMAQCPSEIVGDLPRVHFRLETFGSLVNDLVARGITRLCIAGGLPRPAVDPSLIDPATTTYLARLQAALGRSEDVILREIIAIIEEAGIDVVGAIDIAPDLLPEAGLQTGAVSEGIEVDLAAAQAAHADMARTGPGQAVVARGGHVVAREGARGTEAMLRELAAAKDAGGGWTLDPFDLADQVIGGAADWLSAQDAGDATSGGILYVAPRPGQDLRADMPLFGPGIARAAVEARLRGIVIEAGGVMLLSPEMVRDTLAAAGLFLWVRPDGQR